MPDISPKPALDPLSRTSEAIFGLLMALSFTGAITITSDSANWMETVIIAALTCNIAWGLTDAMMYLLSNVIDRGHRIHVANQILAAEPDTAVELVRAEVGDWVNVSLADNQLRQVVDLMRRNRAKPDHAALLRSDLKGAVSVFITVVLATFPPILPLLFVRNPDLALRLSNLVSVLFLIFLGAVLDRLIGARLRFALMMPLIGMGLVAIIVALGG